MQDSMSTPLRLSVGIPTYNQAAFLAETLDSLLNQTRPPDEIVVSDHFSTDNTQEVLARYASYIRFTQPPAGSNLTGQYNHTLSAQSGDWITLLSSDDIALPNFCEVLVRGAARSERAALVRAGWKNIDSAGKKLAEHYMMSVPREEQPPATLLSQKNGPKVSFASFAIRRSAFEAAGPILASLESLADWGLFVQLAPFGSFVYEAELISGYRIEHDGNKFKRRLGMWIRDEVRMFTEVFPRAAEQAGVVDRTWIQQAFRANFHRYLAAAAGEYPTQLERVSVTPLFQEWASLVGTEALLLRFANGDTIEEAITLQEKIKRFARPYVQSLYTRLRR